MGRSRIVDNSSASGQKGADARAESRNAERDAVKSARARGTHSQSLTRNKVGMKVLFVCLGNVFRSPMAEAFYNMYAHDHGGTSAGVEASAHQLDGRLVSEECMVTIQLMREVGVDISGKRSRQLTPAMVDEADLVVYLADRDHLPDFLAKCGKLRRWPTKDLIDGPDPGRLPPIGSHHLWTTRCNADSIGAANYGFAAGIRDQIGRRVKGLLEDEGRQ